MGVIRRGHAAHAPEPSGQVIRRGHVNRAPQNVVTEGDVTVLVEDAVAEIEAGLASLSIALNVQQTVFAAELRLPVGRRSGAVVIAHEEPLDEAFIGGPVLVGAAPHQGAIETIVFAGEVLNTRQVRLHWSAPGPTPSRVRVNYVIGRR